MMSYSGEEGVYEEWRVQGDQVPEFGEMPPYDFVWSPRINPHLMEQGGKNAEECARGFAKMVVERSRLVNVRLSKRVVQIGEWQSAE